MVLQIAETIIFSGSSLAFASLNVRSRLQRWSFFSCDAMAMFYFLQRCDIDYFLTFPTIAIVAIIFPNHRDRLFSDVCIILRFLGVFEGFWRFWVFSRSFGGFGWVFGGFGGFLRGLLGFGGFSR